MSITNVSGAGESADKPLVLGVKDDSTARFVETTGLYEGVPKGTQVWVTGSKVQIGIERGNLVPLSPEGHPGATKVTRASKKGAQQPPPVASTAPWSSKEPVEEPAPEPEEVDPVDPDAPEDGPYNPANYTVAQVVDYINDHPDEASAVLAAERAGKNRSTIMKEFS